MRRSPSTGICRLLIPSLLAIAAATDAAVETPPFELALALAPVEVAIDDAQVDVIVEPGAQPVVRAHVAPGSAGVPPGFGVSQSGGRVRIVRRADDAAVETATVALELVLDPSQALRLLGQRLSIVVRNPPAPPQPAKPVAPGKGGGDAEKEAPPETAVQSYELVDCELSTSGAATTSVIAENTVVHVEGASGDLTVELTLGSLSLRRHRGNVSLVSLDAESTVEDLEGAVSFQIEGGSLELRSGTGGIQGTSTRGFVSCERWSGIAGLTGEDASFTFRDGRIDQLRLTGRSTDLRIDGLRGSVFTQLEGGGVVAESVVGSFEATAAAGATVEVAGHDGPVTVVARDDSSAELSGIGGLVTASLELSSMTLDGADSLKLTANDSRVTAAGIRQLAGCEARSSELGLDLRALEARHLDLRVPDGSVLEVVLLSPCQVQLRDSAAASQQVDVTGCEFQLQNTGRWRGGMRRDANGRPPFLLTAKVVGTGLLRVRGGP